MNVYSPMIPHANSRLDPHVCKTLWACLRICIYLCTRTKFCTCAFGSAPAQVLAIAYSFIRRERRT